MKSIFLKQGRDKSIRNQHPWIFSGAISSIPDFEDGEMLSVRNAADEYLGSGYFNRRSSIIGRMVAFDKTPPLEAIEKNLMNAINLRNSLFDKTKTDAYRLINGEGDFIPGLIVDVYNDILVIQISTLGIDRLRNWVVGTLIRLLKPRAIYENSQVAVRAEEGLKPMIGTLYGSHADEVEILENGLKFIVPLKDGQKTGFFLDHREMRDWVKNLSRGKNVLNCFSYTGAFSIYAAAGGAKKVDSVDISEKALRIAERNFALNQIDGDHQFITADVFEFLRKDSLNYDLIVMDPPAFAKRKKDLIQACRGYKDINRIAIQKIPANGILLTSSCSYHIDQELFQQVVFQAAIEANRNVRIIGRHRLAADHPVSLYHPEGDYLKSLLLFVE